MWHAAIVSAAGTDSKALGDQQLTKKGVPIIVDSCVAFVTQYGELTHQEDQNLSRTAPPWRRPRGRLTIRSAATLLRFSLPRPVPGGRLPEAGGP